MTPEQLRESLINYKQVGGGLAVWWANNVLSYEKRRELMLDGHDDWCDTMLDQFPDDDALMAMYCRWKVEDEPDET